MGFRRAFIAFLINTRVKSSKYPKRRMIKLALAAMALLAPSYSVAFDVPSTATSSSNGTASFTITWNCSGNYCVLQEKNGTSWQSITSSGSGSASETLVRSNGSYYFRLQTCVVTGSRYGTTTDCSYSAQKGINVGGTPGTPGSFSLSKPYTNDGAFTVNWGSSTNFAPYYAYNLFRQKNGGSWQYVRTQSSSSYTESGLSEGSYRYRVNACGSGCSGHRYSNTIFVSKPTAVPGLALAEWILPNFLVSLRQLYGVHASRKSG